jgi:cytochrome c oxidase cbb3-type subunit 1
MGLVLMAQGLQQGFMLIAGTEWVHSMNAIRPYWWVRTLTGLSMDAGMTLVVYVLMKTSLTRPIPGTTGAR